jgi:DMSO reductase anchor subunit
MKYQSSLQTAIGVRHTKIQQKAIGAMGGSYNTREFFHNKKAIFIKSIKWVFLLMVFIIPIILLVVGYQQKTLGIFWAAFIIQYIGLLAERWFFFAQARHPQNLYYQTI